MLGDAEELWQNQRKAVQIAQINYTAAVSVECCWARRCAPKVRPDHRDELGRR
ncbi:putative decaprenylphosphoryl-D-2-keto erythropentose reductase [Mycobacterium xenopi 4042]|uniref:Putative decaprenylphosphoryl-D-2-keto erythropentose reductase n=1 Tax=Mycobacterium xenopi 4042 TaxID=1299334 RepID=X8DKV8_MYCXE|nr:putative decaprenylphosphoryl-D-2-keto erythropentose reductase [Mycobacterium xenopi 4042]